jgi:hypothetical protein
MENTKKLCLQNLENNDQDVHGDEYGDFICTFDVNLLTLYGGAG